MIFESFASAKNHWTLLSFDGWKDKKQTEFAYYRNIYIENQKNFSDKFIRTTPARAPQNYFSNGCMTLFRVDTGDIISLFSLNHESIFKFESSLTVHISYMI